MVGERRLTCRTSCRRAQRRVAGGARGRLVWRQGRNAFTSCTNYFHSRTHSHALRTFAPHICRTHRPTVTPSAHPPGYTPSRRACVLFFTHHFFFVAYLCAVPYFYTRMTNQHRNRSKADAQAQLNQVLEWTDNNPMKKTLLPILQAEVARFEQAEASAARAAKAKATHEAKCSAYNALPFFRRLFASNPANA